MVVRHGPYGKYEDDPKELAKDPRYKGDSKYPALLGQYKPVDKDKKTFWSLFRKGN